MTAKDQAVSPLNPFGLSRTSLHSFFSGVAETRGLVRVATGASGVLGAESLMTYGGVAGSNPALPTNRLTAMAYSRWADSDWYIFWECSKAGTPKEEERLAVWHAGCEGKPSVTLAEVKEMLASGDYSRIQGFTKKSRKRLTECMQAFVYDVEKNPLYARKV